MGAPPSLILKALQHPTVPDAEHKRLLTNLRAGDASARSDLLLCNMRLVLHCIFKLFGHGIKDAPADFDDLVQEGVLGLNRAIDRFDLSRDVTFTTYAVYWIEANLRTGLERSRRMIGTSASVVVVDIDSKPSPGAHLTLGEMLEDDAALRPDVVVERKNLDEYRRRKFDDAMAQLPEREQATIRGHLLEGRTLAEIGDEMGFSYQWAQQLQQRGLRKLGQILGRKHLQD